MKNWPWIKREAIALALCLVIGGILILMADWAGIELTKFTGWDYRTNWNRYYLILIGPYLLLMIARIGRLAVRIVMSKDCQPNKAGKEK